MGFPLSLKTLRTDFFDSGFRLLFLAVLVGIIAGCGAIICYHATNAVDQLMLGKVANHHPPHEGVPVGVDSPIIDSLHLDFRWFLFLIPMLGGLISGWRVYTFAPEAEGQGTGGAAGREDPIAQIGAGFGSMRIPPGTLDETPVVDPAGPQKVLYLLSRRSLLAYYAEQVGRTREVMAR
jgi:CIC family chloride channel protein